MTDKQIDNFLQDYQKYYEQIFKQEWLAQDYPLISEYADSLLEQFSHYTKMKKSDSFWADFAKVVAFDSKLHLLEFFIGGLQDTLMEFKETDILAMIEKEYASYYSENMGYQLNHQTTSSLLFLIERCC